MLSESMGGFEATLKQVYTLFPILVVFGTVRWRRAHEATDAVDGDAYPDCWRDVALAPTQLARRRAPTHDNKPYSQLER